MKFGNTFEEVIDKWKHIVSVLIKTQKSASGLHKRSEWVEK